MILLVIAAAIYTVVAIALTTEVTENVSDFFFVFIAMWFGLIPVFALEYLGRLITKICTFF